MKGKASSTRIHDGSPSLLLLSDSRDETDLASKFLSWRTVSMSGSFVSTICHCMTVVVETGAANPGHVDCD